MLRPLALLFSGALALSARAGARCMARQIRDPHRRAGCRRQAQRASGRATSTVRASPTRARRRCTSRKSRSSGSRTICPMPRRFMARASRCSSQTAGTLGKPIDLAYDELKHYKIPQPADAKVVTGMMTLTPPGRRDHAARLHQLPPLQRPLLPAPEIHRSGARYRRASRSLPANPGSSKSSLSRAAPIAPRCSPGWPTGSTRIIRRCASRLRRPAGAVGIASARASPRKNVMDNLAAIAKDAPQLKYVQLDDGYQPAMGDWLETGKAFGGDVQGVLQAIRKQGFEPAIWVAPVHRRGRQPRLPAASRTGSCKGDDGKPLPADKVTFQGWRRGPWYALDGTNPEVQKHLENVFRTMRQEWGVHLFQARRELLGRDARRQAPRPQGHAHRGLSPRHAGGPARRGRQLHPGLQSSRSGRRSA